MHLNVLLALGIAPAMAAVLNPRAVECDFSTAPDSGATCASFASSWGLSVADLKKLNPGITCPGLDTTKSYCIIGTATDEPTSTTSTTSKTTTTTTTTTSKTTTSKTTTTQPAASNEPTMPGIVSNCDGFHQVASGDQCDTIAAKYGISEAQFRSWNTQVDSSMY